MLSFHVLNVGKGSSIVVEFEAAGASAFGVIDSNALGDALPKALAFLRKRNVSTLSFLSLTHPHADHFRGLFSVIAEPGLKIEHFYSCPFGDLLANRTRFTRIQKSLKEIRARTDGMEERRAALELGQILVWADQGAREGRLVWHECRGESFSIAPPGFAGVQVTTIQPPSRMAGRYVARIESGDMNVIGNFRDNEISLAFLFSYKGKNIILGGDATRSNWESRRRYETHSGAALNGDAVNLPHHGSRHDCSVDVVSQLFATNGERYAVSSGNGVSHPHVEVINDVESRGILPYCTNLIPECGANALQLLPLPNLAPEMARWIREVSANRGKEQACQGDVTIRIADDGAMEVVPEFRNYCGYRQDYSTFLAGQP